MPEKLKKKWFDKLAGIQYSGIGGSSNECQEAVTRFLTHDHVDLCRILTAPALDGGDQRSHCLLLTINNGDLAAIKSGFSSGYRGGGPHALSFVLELLDAHKVEVQEFDVNEEFLDRIDAAALTKADLVRLESMRPVRPRRWSHYVFDKHWIAREEKSLWREVPVIIPFGIMEPRLIDLAITFWDAPDEKLLIAYRRLEDIVRERTNLRGQGAKLFSQAFLGDKAVLSWSGLDESERVGRAHLFAGTYQAYRNPRAHREPKQDWSGSQLCELLILNQLYRFEADAELVSSLWRNKTD